MSERLPIINQRNKEKSDPIYRGKSYYSQITYPNIPFSDMDTYVVTVTGDRLERIAYEAYGDIDLWWVIAVANPEIIKRDSLMLKPGLSIRIPYDTEAAIRDYERLNQNF